MDHLNPRESIEKPRDEAFSPRAKSRICKELPTENNPYLAKRVLWHGYDACDLMNRRDYVDVVFLLLKGELPNDDEKALFGDMLIALANPGPRHPAARAVMSVGASNTRPPQILPIGLSLMSGEHLGAGEVMAAMRFLSNYRSENPSEVATRVISGLNNKGSDGRVVPGFGVRFGGRDPIAESFAKLLLERNPQSKSVRWGSTFVASGLEQIPAGWLMSGLAAAVFLDLGFSPEVGGGVFQAAAWPGLLAHGVEMFNESLTAMPFVSDENYHFVGEDDAG